MIIMRLLSHNFSAETKFSVLFLIFIKPINFETYSPLSQCLNVFSASVPILLLCFETLKLFSLVPSFCLSAFYALEFLAPLAAILFSFIGGKKS